MKPMSIQNKKSLFSDTEINLVDTNLIANIAIGIWRIKNSLILEKLCSSELEETRTWKNLQRLINRLENAGIKIQDKNGEPYDAGMALRVVSVERRDDLKSAMIIEMITPTVFHHDTILHAGEVVIGKPETL